MKLFIIFIKNKLYIFYLTEKNCSHSNCNANASAGDRLNVSKALLIRTIALKFEVGWIEYLKFSIFTKFTY